jgi:TonB family protein
VPTPADPVNVAGVLNGRPDTTAPSGSGTGGLPGTGRGAGMGEGDGAGIGPGSGGGTGGGPYRPGSGVDAPRVIREVRALYTDEARRRGIEGDVVLELIVTQAGTVDRVRVVRGLGAGLDQSAIAAVKQWRFEPARRQGAPVDVVVDISIEFRMRDF